MWYGNLQNTNTKSHITVHLYSASVNFAKINSVSHTSPKGVNEFVHILSRLTTVGEVWYGRSLHIAVEHCEFCKNWCSVINTIFKAVHIVFIFHWICKKFGASDSHKNLLSGC
jgi:hypothetical protein